MRKLYRVKTFSLSDDACTTIETYAQRTGLSQTKILELLLSRPDAIESILGEFIDEKAKNLRNLVEFSNQE